MFLMPVSSRHATLSPEFSRVVDRLFDDTFDRFFGSRQQEGGDAAAAQRSPALDVAETDAGYTVTIDLPGVAKEDVKVSVDGRRVTVEAQTRSAQEKKEGERVIYRERSVSSYSRSFTLPVEIDQGACQAKLEHGVLTLSLAKKVAPTATQLTVS